LPYREETSTIGRINFRVQTSLKPLCNRGVPRYRCVVFISSFHCVDYKIIRYKEKKNDQKRGWACNKI